MHHPRSMLIRFLRTSPGTLPAFVLAGCLATSPQAVPEPGAPRPESNTDAGDDAAANTASAVSRLARHLVTQAAPHTVFALNPRTLNHSSLWTNLDPIVEEPPACTAPGSDSPSRDDRCTPSSSAPARLSPHFGFNLHDQRPRLTEDGRPVAVSADPLVDGRVTRYDEAHNTQALGDAVQSWGTSTVLLETGDWEDDPDKAYLRQVNFALLLTALDAIATRSFEHARLQVYESLPGNRPMSNR
jgi:hypothetical protein